MKSSHGNKSSISFVEVFDIYGHPFSLHLFGKPKYKTLVGSLFGLISSMLMVTVALYFIIDLLQRKSVTVIYNEDTNQFPINNLSDIPIMMSLGDYNGVTLDPTGLYSFDVKMLNYKRIVGADGIARFGLEIAPIQIEKCDLTKHFLDKGEKFQSLRISSYYCIPPGKNNVTLYGKLGDTLNGWSFLAIFLNRCNTKFQKCLNDTYAESVLGNSALTLAMLSHSINHYNTTSPNQEKVQTVVLPMSSAIIKNYYYNIRQVIYTTDYGFIFEERYTENFYTYQSQSLDVNLKNSGLPTIGPNFGYLMLKNDDAVSNYTRVYIKGQAVMANIGGIIKAIMVITKIMSDFFTRRMSYVELCNSIFEYDFEEDSLGKNDKKVPYLKYNNTTNKLPKKESVIRLDTKSLKSSTNHKRRNTFVSLEALRGHCLAEQLDQNSLKIRPSIMELICPMFIYKKNTKLQYLNQSQSIVRKKLSVETMIEKYYKIDRLAKMLLSETQIKEYYSISKINFDRAKEIEEMDFSNRNKQIIITDVSAISGNTKSIINLNPETKNNEFANFTKHVENINKNFDLVLKNKFT